MILGLLKLWMSFRVPHMDMDSPHPFHIKHIMIYLINACIRYDKTKKANISKTRNVYNSTAEPADVDYPQDAPDLPCQGIDLPSDVFYHIHALSYRHPPPSRPIRTTKVLQKV